MIRSFLLIILVAFSFFSSAQNNELIYTKFLFDTDGHSGISKLLGNSGFMVPYSFYTNSDSVDLGVWSESYIELTNGYNDTIYQNQIGFYDNQFNLFNNLPIIINGGYGNSSFYAMQFAHAENSKAILYFSNNIPSQANYDYTSGIYTPLGNFVPDEPTQCIFIEFDPLSDEIIERFRYTESYAEPYPNYFKASFDQSALRKNAGQVFTVLNDHTLLAYLNLCGDRSVITPLDTISFTSLNGQQNSLRIELDLISGEMSTAQIGSGTGNISVLSMQASNDLTNLYRMGLVRGNNTPISISGNEIEMPPNDSLYRVFITKEDANGATQWLTELYAYNNIASDTLSESSTDRFTVRNQFSGLIEKSNAVFVASNVKVDASAGDTLIYKDFLGQNYKFQDYVPIHSISGFPNPNEQIAFSERAIYKLDQNGKVIKKMSHTDKQSGYESPTSTDFFFSTSYATGSKNLYEVDDRLAWVNNYFAENDSIGEFIYQNEDGTQNITTVNLPAGKGVYILWLDADLNIVDKWIFRYEDTPVAAIYSMAITAIVPYAQDTVLVQGKLGKAITTNLDPSGNSSDFTTQSLVNFFAFYSSTPTSTENIEPNGFFEIFPNPTREVINISEANTNNGFYTVFDLSGRVVIKGKIANTQINIQGLKPGMYVLSIESEKGKGVQKFVVR